MLNLVQFNTGSIGTHPVNDHSVIFKPADSSDVEVLFPVNVQGLSFDCLSAKKTASILREIQERMG